MLWKASSLEGFAIAASDGHLGKVSDFLFEDTNWSIRWLVVDTGTWLSGRKVLLPPSVLEQVDHEKREFHVGLTRQGVKDSPDIDADRPVSRQMESSIYGYYGWSPYWSDDLYMGAYGYMTGASMAGGPVLGSGLPAEVENTLRNESDPHLRSIAAVTGYHIHARDGEIGHVENFFVDDADWTLRYLVVDTKNWWPGEKVLIAPRSVRSIDWAEKLVNLGIDRQKVKDSPRYDGSTTVDPDYEARLHGYYDDDGHTPPGGQA